MRQTALNALGWLLGLMAVLLVTVWLGQRRLIYLPDQVAPVVAPGVEEVALITDDRLELTAWRVGEGDILVLVLPGNAGHRGYRLPLAAALAEEGMATLLIDYRGYGGNPGSPSEEGLLLDALAAQRWAEKAGYTRIVYLGESLGSGPAAALAIEKPPTGMVLRSPFPELAAVGRTHYPFLPVGWLLRDRFPVSDGLGRPDFPLVVVAGDHDTIVPIELSMAVADATGADLIIVGGADHNDAELSFGPTVISAVSTVAGKPPGS